MNIQINKQNNIVIIAIQGSVDSKTAGELQSQIMEQVSDQKKVIISFVEVEFLSSAGLRVLLMVYRQLKANDGKVILVGLSEEIYDTMSMTGFVNFFEIANTLEEAKTQF